MFFGEILSNASGKSFINPGSNSIVVIEPVEPGTNTLTIPFLTFELSIIFCILQVRRIDESYRTNII